MGERLIFQLGTNNWQRDGEFAPGSGILHESHHAAFNALPDTRAYSLYPSRRQRFVEEQVRVFELDHDIPIAESISPVSNYRWHAMSQAEVTAYRERLVAEVFAWTNEIEERRGGSFSLFIAHHGFMNPVVLRDVNRLRTEAGQPRVPVLCFVHGTELKMYANEQREDNNDDYPLRFLPWIRAEGIFDPASPEVGVDVVAAISTEQVAAFERTFPEFPRERVLLSPNGYNQRAFRVLPDVVADRDTALAEFSTQPYQGSPHAPRPVSDPLGFDAVVTFCGKFADWKRLDVLLRAASHWEARDQRIATVVVGSGPLADQQKYQDLAATLGLQRTFFVGPRGQDDLAVLFNAADVACFPARNEPFGLVFIESMACGTPVVGADSGGPRDFVTSQVGALVPEDEDSDRLARAFAAQVLTALDEDWKRTKGPEAARYAAEEFSVVRQVENLLAGVDRLL